jgi:predicted ATP-dependent endonuclease of OLD family
MQLVSAAIGPFRSVNTTQTLAVDPDVTVLVGMNEAGKTVLLKALHKAVDALKEDEFDPIEDYPRRDLSSYLKRHSTDPETAVVLHYELTEAEVQAINKRLGINLMPGHKLSITHKYDNEMSIGITAERDAVAKALAKSFSTDAAEALKDCTDMRQIPAALASASLTESDQATLASINVRIAATKWDDVAASEAWIAVSGFVPKFLYFSDYDLLPGKMNLADLANRVEKAKSDPGHLKPMHRSVLALLRMADVSIADLSTPGGYEELKAKIEAVSISLTDQVMEFWKQNEDLEVEVDIKPDSTDEAPFNSGPNLYLRIKNRRHRGVSTPFDQRSRGFIWFFSFLVWFDSVQFQIDPTGKSAGRKLILLLDEPGLALHALAQADFLRYIDKLAQSHQVLYTTHSPFMINSDRLNQVRVVEDQPKTGTVVSENLAGSDSRTIFPLQAALGWTVAQNLFISKRNLLVEGPSELLYLQAVSAMLEQSGGGGLRPDLTIVPTGGLDNLATFIALLGASGLKLVVLHDYKGLPEQKLAALVKDKLMAAKSLFHVGQFRDATAPHRASDIEDLFPVETYLDYFRSTFSTQLGGASLLAADLPPGDRVVHRLEQHIKAKGLNLRPSGGFNHYLVASRFATSPPSTLDPDTLNRFKALFAAVNGAV